MRSAVLKFTIIGCVFVGVIVLLLGELSKVRNQRDQLAAEVTRQSGRIAELDSYTMALRKRSDRTKRLYLAARDAELKYKPIWMQWQGQRFSPVAADTSLAHLEAEQSQQVDRFRRSASDLLTGQSDSTSNFVVGRESWMYFKAELQAANCSSSFYESTLPGIRNAAQALAGKGIHLIVCPVPTKWEMHPEGIHAEGRQGADLNPQRSAFLGKLRSAGVDCVDVAPVFHEALADGTLTSAFFKLDTHWTPAAIALAAEAIRKSISTHSLGKNLPGAKLDLQLKPRQAVLDRADLLASLNEAQVELASLSGFDPKPERFAFEEVVGYQNVSGPVLVTGRSFSSNDPGGAENAGLAPRLAALLGHNVRHHYGGVGGLHSALKDSPDFFDGVQFVVWVFPGRDFWEGNEQFSTDRLSTDMFGAVPAGGQSEVAAAPVAPESIAELLVSAAPPELSKSQLIYRELISSFAVAMPDGSSQVYYYQSIKDRQLVVPRFVHKGDRLQVRTIPWQEQVKANPEFESYAVQDPLSDLDQEIHFVSEWLQSPGD